MATTIIRRAAAGAIAVSGLLHFVLVPEYLSEKPYIGVLFLLSVPLTGMSAFLLWVRADRVGWALGALTVVGMIGGFVMSRTVGLPGYHASNWSEGFPSLGAEFLFLGLAWMARSEWRSKHGSTITA